MKPELGGLVLVKLSLPLILVSVLLVVLVPSVNMVPQLEKEAVEAHLLLKSISGNRNSKSITTTGSNQISSFSWEHNISSTHFSVHYNTTGWNKTTQEYAQNISNSLEHSWTVEVSNFGFNAPPDSLMNVYLMDVADAGITTSYLSLTGWHVDNITIDIGLIAGLANVTCAHEFFHTIQLSYYTNSIDAPEKKWISEGTAAWMESMVYPEYVGVGSYIDYVNDYMDNPDITITNQNYSAVLYWIFLGEHYGGIDTIKNVWQQTTSKDGIYAVNATLNTKGTTFSKVFKEWTIANYLKDSSYSMGYRFHTVYNLTLQYDGTLLPLGHNIADWCTDYFQISSNVIFMPILFEGGQSHNLTKILVEHSLPLASDFLLNSTHLGFFPLMQANNLDKIVIIVRSLGNETSNNQVHYTLKLLASSYTLDGPKQLASSATVLAIVKTTSSDVSSTVPLTLVNTKSFQVSATSTIATVSSSTAQISSPKTTAVVGKSSSRSSSETGLINVRMEGDVNGDGTVNTIDLEAFSRAYGSTLGNTNWNPNCDFNSDNIINVLDLQKLAKNYGKSV